jgi:hypothetical protein
VEVNDVCVAHWRDHVHYAFLGWVRGTTSPGDATLRSADAELSAARKAVERYLDACQRAEAVDEMWQGGAAKKHLFAVRGYVYLSEEPLD